MSKGLACGIKDYPLRISFWTIQNVNNGVTIICNSGDNPTFIHGTIGMSSSYAHLSRENARNSISHAISTPVAPITTPLRTFSAHALSFIRNAIAPHSARMMTVSANAALRQHTDRAHETLRCVQRDGTAKINAIEHANATILERIVQLQVELAQGERALQATRVGYNEMIAKAQRAADAAAQATEGLTDPDVAAVRAQIQSAEHLNRQVRVRQAAVRQRTTLQERYDAVAATSAHLTSQIEAIDQRKVDLYATAAFPIEGLAVAQDPKGAYYLTYHDIPISQCSASEQTEIGLSIAGALNPRLKVILIREASLMDEETHARVNAWAEKRGFQVWLEIVSESGDGFVMEEGELKADKQGSLL